MRENGDHIKIVTFKLRDEIYGVDVQYVQSIERMQAITRIPHAPKFVKGVVNLRGKVIAVIDLRGRFEMEETTYSDSTRIIITSMADMEVGLIVDDANDVIDIEYDIIEAPPESVCGVKTNYLQGVAKMEDSLITLLNLSNILSLEEENKLKELSS